MLALLQQLQEKKLINVGDYYFAKFIANKSQAQVYPLEKQNLAIFLAALCSYHYQQGHTCIDLSESVLSDAFYLPKNEAHYLTEIQQKIKGLPVSQWQSLLADHVAFTDDPAKKNAPFVFQYNALYFYRAWQDEQRIVQYLHHATTASAASLAFSIEQIAQIMQRYFPHQDADNRPKIAVATAIRQSFCLITGGPGTGKTTAVTRLLLALQDLHQGKLRIKLAAPTGKAAARLKESMQKTLAFLQDREKIQLDKSILDTIPTEAETLHRLLGVSYFEENTKYHAQNPLPLDLLVVDEASMIDLTLMAKLLAALKPSTKLILLGDKDQLASVEAGAILAELGQFSERGYRPKQADYLRQVVGGNIAECMDGRAIGDSLCHLLVSRRFGDKPYIAQLANLINHQQSKAAWQLLTQATENEIHLVDFDGLSDRSSELSTKENIAVCVNAVVESAVHFYHDYLQILQEVVAQHLPISEHLPRIFAAFNSVRFLTALRVGELGSEYLNQAIAERLRQVGLVNFQHSRDSYLGKPVMIMQNDSNTRLSNGDIGLYIMEREGDKIRGKYWFENGKSELASRIPSHEPAFVMTVHKSQGSEFDHTFLVLPTEPNPVLSKELVYTGVTRAKSQLTIFANRLSWESAVNKQTTRQSRLGQGLVLAELAEKE